MKYLLAEYENKWKNDIFRNYYYIIQELIKYDFKLLDKPRPCTSKYCPCNEWAFLLVER